MGIKSRDNIIQNIKAECCALCMIISVVRKWMPVYLVLAGCGLECGCTIFTSGTCYVV